MSKTRKLVVLLALTLLASGPAFSKTVSVQDLTTLSSMGKDSALIPGKTYSKEHWAYKTLESTSKKYGLLVGKPEQTFDGAKSLTKNEAAVLLVSLLGKIDQDKAVLDDAEKAQIDILKNELKDEMTALGARITSLETSVNTLQGSVSKIEKNDEMSFKHNFGDSFKITGGSQFKYTSEFHQRDVDGSGTNFTVPIVELNVTGKMYPHLFYNTTLYPMRTFTSVSKSILGDAYFYTDIVKNNKIYFGQTRVPIGYEGVLSPVVIEVGCKSQIARKFSDYRDVGVKAMGSYKYMDYSLGVYNGTKNNTADNNSDLDIASWFVFKPLADYPQYGKLDVGGGYHIGKNTNNLHDWSFYTGYNYKKYALKAEYAFRDGYAVTGKPISEASGWYISNIYNLTPKIQLVGRLDRFDGNRSIDNDTITEYTLGINYLLAGNNIKFLTDFVHVENKGGNDSQRVVFTTNLVF